MGSSTASETTINTSTDSSNTIVTTMTATDGDTEDSLDINEPLDYLNTDNITDCKTQILQPIVLNQTPPQTAKQDTPATAMRVDANKFSFEVESPKKEAEPIAKREPPKIEGNNITKDVDTLMNEQIEALRIDARRRNSYKAAQNDFDKIEIMPDDDYKTQSRRSSYRSDNDVTSSPKPKHRQKKTSRKQQHHSPGQYSKGDKFTYDEKHIAKYRDKARMTPPLPDLRVDFFNETMDGCQQQQQITTGTDSLYVPPAVSGEKRGSVCLNKCLREVGAQLEANATSPINVTTNPLENSVHFGGRKAPQATIVVQQPSLSLDHSNVSTILLKNGSEFLSNVESVGNSNNKLTSLKKQKEENMKQLLDVANNLTLEEIHDFEMR